MEIYIKSGDKNHNGNKKEHILSTYKAGEVFGIKEFISGNARVYNCRTT